MPSTLVSNPVLEPAAAPAPLAMAHFDALLSFETDCWDVHSMVTRPEPGCVLLDVRSPEAYAQGHVPMAISFPHRRIAESTLTQFPAGTLFVTYCAGPHCNGADKAALRLAMLGRPVKKMIGGVTGWLDEGFELVKG